MFVGVQAAQYVGEVSLLLTEILVAVNQPTGNPIAQLTVDCCVQWLATRDCSSVVLQAFLRVLGTTVLSSEALGAILEAALQAFFKRTSKLLYLCWVTLHCNIFKWATRSSNVSSFVFLVYLSFYFTLLY
jgi:hypothetical protein